MFFWIAIALQFALIARTVWIMRVQCTRNRAVSAWTEWLLIIQLGCLGESVLPGFVGIPAWCLVVVGVIGMLKEMRAENRRSALRLAELREASRRLDEDIAFLVMQVQARRSEQSQE